MVIIITDVLAGMLIRCRGAVQLHAKGLKGNAVNSSPLPRDLDRKRSDDVIIRENAQVTLSNDELRAHHCYDYHIYIGRYMSHRTWRNSIR